MARSISPIPHRRLEPNRLRVHPTVTPHQRSEEHTSELQSQSNLVCRLLLEKKKNPALQLCFASYTPPFRAIISITCSASNRRNSVRPCARRPSLYPPNSTSPRSTSQTTCLL